MNKIALMVMTQKGFEVTKHLANLCPGVIEHVVIGQDNAISNDFHGELQQLCETNSIDYSFKKDKYKVSKSTYIFAISWRWMIEHPEERLVVFHDSILPKYRGFAPLVNGLINGEKEIGVSAILGAKEYDRGDIIAQNKISISYPIKIQEAIDRNMRCFLDLALNIAQKIHDGKPLDSYPQKGEPTYSIWRDDEDYFIDWKKSACEIKRLIDAVGPPYRGAKSKTSKGQTITISDAEVIEDVPCELRHIGKVIFMENGHPIIICGNGLLKITNAHTLNPKNNHESFLPMKNFRVKFL